MTLSIREARPATPEEWDSVWERCDYSTYFHSREWSEIWRDYTGGKTSPAPERIVFSDGREAILPFSRRRRLKGLLTEYLSSPAGTFGGWLSADELEAEHAVCLAHYITRSFPDLLWRLNPYDPLVRESGVVIAEEDVTQVLDLSCGLEPVIEKWTTGRGAMARKVRKARRAGVTVRTASSIEDWSSYHGIYRQSLERWGRTASSAHGPELFEAIRKRGSPRIELWLAVHEERPIAGAICFYSRHHAVYWHGAALAAFFERRPVNLLISEVIRDASERGCRWFDFNPSGGHRGVEAFKKSFGSTARPCALVRTSRCAPRRMLRVLSAGVARLDAWIPRRRRGAVRAAEPLGETDRAEEANEAGEAECTLPTSS